jgi:hypothetical protein
MAHDVFISHSTEDKPAADASLRDIGKKWRALLDRSPSALINQTVPSSSVPIEAATTPEVVTNTTKSTSDQRALDIRGKEHKARCRLDIYYTPTSSPRLEALSLKVLR